MYYNWLRLVFFFEYFRPGTYIPGLNLLKIGTILPLSLVALAFVKKLPADYMSNSQFFKIRDTRWLLFFMFLIVLSVLTADVTLYSYRVLKGVIGYFFLYYLIIRLINDQKKLKGLFGVLIISHILLLFLNPEIILNPATRSYINHNYLGDGNDFALSINILVPLAIFTFFNTKKTLVKFAALGGLAALILTVIGTQSRGGTLALACILAYLWWHSARKIYGIVALVVVAGLVFAYAPEAYFDRMESIAHYQEEGSAQGRIVAWKASLRMAADHPLLGVGAGHFPVKFGAEYYPPDAPRGPWLTAHSIYFLALGELGIPGIVFLFSVMFGSMLKIEKKVLGIPRAKREKLKTLRQLLICLNASIIGFAVGGAFLSVLYYPHLFVILGIKSAVLHILETHTASQERPVPAHIEVPSVHAKTN